jgi:hypothetical protein
MKETVNTCLRTDGVLEIYVGNRLLVEVTNGRSDEWFIEDVLHAMGYDWLQDGTITNSSETKASIYDEMCRVLTDYENREVQSDNIDWEADLYEMLVKIQNNWETVITAQEEN